MSAPDWKTIMVCPGCGMQACDCQPEDQPEDQPDGVHSIPVPRGWTPEQAWEAISRGDRLLDHAPRWANIVVKDGKLVELLPAYVDPSAGRQA